MDLGIDVSSSQHLHITPTLKLGIQIMAMSSLELQGFLAGALSENPFLTFAEEDGEALKQGEAAFDEVPVRQRPSETGPDPFASFELRELPQSPDELLDTMPQRSGSLEQSLYEQLCLELHRDKDLEIARHLIFGLDERGYLFIDTATLATGLSVTQDHVEWVLKKLQTECTPAGIGARSLPERLIAQLEAVGDADPLARHIIGTRLEELADGRFARIAGELHIPVAEVKEIFERLRKLDPNPANMADGLRRCILPEIEVFQQRGRWKVRVKEGAFPQVLIDQALVDAIDPSAMDKASARRMMALLHGAEGVIRAVDLRRASLIAVSATVVDAQAAFFSEGPTGMRPLTMLEVATEAEVSEATVSRIAQHAFLETPRGTLPLRGFFTSGVGAASNASGEDASAVAVKQAIQQIVDAEDKAHPVSDAQIVDALEERGMNVSRRTVNKYRTALGILSRSKRRKY